MYNFEVSKTFREDSPGEFVARTTSSFSSGPYVVASIARRRVSGDATLVLPDGYDVDVLEHVSWLMGYYDKDVSVSGRQASELREIGMQLLSLNQEGKIQPPITRDEIASIEYMNNLVEASLRRINLSQPQA